MAEPLIKDTLNSTGKIFDTTFEYPIEQEILLADYEEQVFKILKTNVENTVTQKYISNGKLIIEGFFRLTVYYQPPHIAHIATVSKKIPFQKQFDLRTEIASPNFIITAGELQYINTRAVNSQRIDIRGVYALKINIFANQPVEIVTAIDGAYICSDSDEINHFYLIGSGTRQFSLEDDLSVSPEFEKIINITAHNNNMTLSTYQDKVNAKGEILADIAYLNKEDPTVQHLMKTFIYNQVIDAPGTMENSTPHADLNLVNFTVTQNTDTNGIRCVATASLDVKCFSKSTLLCVYDAFSKNYEFEKKEKQISFDENITSVHRSFQLALEDNIPEGYIVTYCFTEMRPLSIETLDGVSNIKSKVTVSAIAQNLQNELECFVKTQDVIFDFGENIDSENEYLLSCDVNSTTTSIIGDVLKAQISVTINGFIVKKQTAIILDEFSEITDKPIENLCESLVLYYAKKNEKIFDIAMKYKTDTDTILKENQLEGKYIDDDRMIFIPVFRM